LGITLYTQGEKMKKKIVNIRKDQRGFSLLEYVAGATVIAAIVFVALNAFGGNLAELFAALGEWVTSRASEIQSTPGIGE